MLIKKITRELGLQFDCNFERKSAEGKDPAAT